MSRVEELTDVPESERKEVEDDFKSEGAAVESTQQANGKWTIRATFPDN